ncbi:MAG: cytochrome c oxidase accessory protein CcoG [Chromatiales bacterium]|jgi:cytochrome c oxidase accessory protein FixG
MASENTDNKQNSNATEELETALYKKREKIYPREVHGIFAKLRNLAMVTLLGLFYGMPWLQYEGHQAIVFDLPARKFYIFGWTFWPQDFIYLTALLIIAAYALFFFTALAGRLWCGYACPQTVWTEIFLWMERKIEGSRQQQMKLDKQPMSANKFARKAGKHSAWLLFSLFTGFTFVGWFTPIDTLATDIIAGNISGWGIFWILFYGFATYGNAGWMREQVCIYMCPYARFQSAMFDKDTLLIAYDENRGEPRGARKKGIDPKEAGLGDCINCGLCVQVCPTGIDIRDGLQYQCIGCAACVDVCDDVMEKVNLPKGLVSYTTEHRLAGHKTHILRPRVIVYATLLVVICAALMYAVATRIPLELDIIRDRNALYLETDEGLIENVYTLKVINMTNEDQTYRLTAAGIEDLQLINSAGDFLVASGGVVEIPVRVQVDPENLKTASSEIYFNVESLTTEGLSLEEAGRFLGPVSR